MQRLSKKLLEPISAESLVFFRIAFGLILFWDVIRHFQSKLIARYWLEPAFHFKYTGFAWVQPLPAVFSYAAWILIGLAALAISLGFYYRFAALYLTFALSYFFLIEEARYMNHSYLIILLCFMLTFLPLNKVFAFDAKREKERTTLPFWVLIVLQFHLALPYFFGGIAKLQADWLKGQPLELWLGGMTDLPVLGYFFGFTWTAIFFSYSGLILDLLAVPLLLWFRTRAFIFLILCSFHFINAHLFNIDIFPWLMIAGSSIFFEPDWPRQLYKQFRQSRKNTVIYSLLGLFGGSLAVYMHGHLNPIVFAVGVLATSLSYFGITGTFSPPKARAKVLKGQKKLLVNPKQYFLFSFLALWMLIQILLPLRHFLIPGVSIWTEEGHRFAWHMMLRSKQGSIRYLADNLRTGEQQEIDPIDYLTPWQYNRFENAPYLIQEFAQHLARELGQTSEDSFRIRARTLVSLNGRPAQPIIDSSIDLAKEPEALWHATWIFPLREDLP